MKEIINALKNTNVIGFQPRKDGEVVYVSLFTLWHYGDGFRARNFPADLPLTYLELVGAYDESHPFSLKYSASSLKLKGPGILEANNELLYLYTVNPLVSGS